jgi:hypothetical protein
MTGAGAGLEAIVQEMIRHSLNSEDKIRELLRAARDLGKQETRILSSAACWKADYGTLMISFTGQGGFYVQSRVTPETARMLYDALHDVLGEG